MPSVSEVIKKIEDAGLVVRRNPSSGSHTLWDIVDPKSGTILTGISSHANRRGGDNNWHWNIRRVLKHAGFRIEFEGGRRKDRPIKGAPRKTIAVDLEALARAQEQAAARGERIPLLDDLDEHPEFLKRMTTAGNSKPYTNEAQDWMIGQMATRADAPKVKFTIDRLKKLMDDRGHELDQKARERLARQGKRASIAEGKGARSEFVRIAMYDVAPVRNLQAWKSESSGQQTLHAVLEKETTGMTLWVMNLLNATMDHIEGLQWGVDESRKKSEPAKEKEKQKQQKSEPAPEPEPEPEPEAETSEGTGLTVVDTATYEVALQLIEEYEDTFREITALAFGREVPPEEWETIGEASKAAKLAVKSLRATSVTLSDEIQQLRSELEIARAATNIINAEPVLLETTENPVREKYAETLLGMLQGYDGKKGEDPLLTAILERLDKLAGI